MNTNNTIACYTQKLAIQMPSEFYRMTPAQIVALCRMDSFMLRMWGPIPPWDSLNDVDKSFYHLKAWWTLRGAKESSIASIQTPRKDEQIDEEWDAECRARGWRVWHPKTYGDLEDEFLPRPIANIRLITARCLQMATLLALRGDVSEPFWWAGLSITEHAEPNFSKECSDGYPGFSEVELEYRRGRIKTEGTKPALCDRLDTVNRGVCEFCRFRGLINSPIALGFSHEPKGGRHG